MTAKDIPWLLQTISDAREWKHYKVAAMLEEDLKKILESDSK